MAWFIEKDSFFISASHSLEGNLKGKSLLFSSVVLDSDKLKYTVEVSTACGTTILTSKTTNSPISSTLVATYTDNLLVKRSSTT